MSPLKQFKMFAEYNRLMNQRLFDAAGKLDKAALEDDRGAFFKSVLGTLNHIIVGDIIWLKRFANHAPFRRLLNDVINMEQPEALDSMPYPDFSVLRAARENLDEVIIDWVAALSESDISDNLSYHNMAGIPQKKPIEDLISHLFLHQVHHRGQVSTLISQSGVDFGDTDILEIIENVT